MKFDHLNLWNPTWVDWLLKWCIPQLCNFNSQPWMLMFLLHILSLFNWIIYFKTTIVYFLIT